MHGLLVLETRLEDIAGTVDISELPAGVYLVKVETGNRTEILKLVKD